jgi:hypothetical protein
VRIDGPECEHGTPGGSPATCALCRLAAATEDARVEQLALWARDAFDARAAAAGER